MKKLLPLIVCATVALSGCIKSKNVIDSSASPPASEETAMPKLNASGIPESTKQIDVVAPVNGPSNQANQGTALPVSGRIWTSTDGRTLAAVLVLRTQDAITIRRNEDRREFSIPLQNLSLKDQEYIRNSGMPITVIKQFPIAKLAQLQKNIPPLSANAPLDSNDPTLVELYGKYKRKIEFISETGFERHVQMLRQQMESDINRLQPIAATSLKSAPYYNQSTHSWSGGSGAWRDVWAARSALTWLQGSLKQYVDNLEQLK